MNAGMELSIRRSARSARRRGAWSRNHQRVPIARGYFPAPRPSADHQWDRAADGRDDAIDAAKEPAGTIAGRRRRNETRTTDVPRRTTLAGTAGAAMGLI